MGSSGEETLVEDNSTLSPLKLDLKPVLSLS